MIIGPDVPITVVDGGLPDVLRLADERCRERIERALVVSANWEQDVCECGHGRMEHCGDDECCNFEMTRQEGSGACLSRDRCDCPVFRLAAPAMFTCDVIVRSGSHD